MLSTCFYATHHCSRAGTGMRAISAWPQRRHTAAFQYNLRTEEADKMESRIYLINTNTVREASGNENLKIGIISLLLEVFPEPVKNHCNGQMPWLLKKRKKGEREGKEGKGKGERRKERGKEKGKERRKEGRERKRKGKEGRRNGRKEREKREGGRKRGRKEKKTERKEGVREKERIEKEKVTIKPGQVEL